MVTVLKLLRIKSGLTLREFARRYGFPETALSCVERGRGYIPPGWRERLAQALNVTVAELCDENGWPKIAS